MKHILTLISFIIFVTMVFTMVKIFRSSYNDGRQSFSTRNMRLSKVVFKIKLKCVESKGAYLKTVFTNLLSQCNIMPNIQMK